MCFGKKRGKRLPREERRLSKRTGSEACLKNIDLAETVSPIAYRLDQKVI